MKIFSSFLALGALSVAAFAADTNGIANSSPVNSTVNLSTDNVSGLHNFHQVNDHVFRGAQPSAEGFASLARLGVKTIVDLRESGGRSKSEQKIVEANGMRYISIPLSGYLAPTDDTVTRLLALFEDRSAGPVFIHCRRGADRTGTICACYRIAHDHWQNDQALNEAKTFGMSWTEKAMQAYVLHYPGLTHVAAAASAAPASSAAAVQ